MFRTCKLLLGVWVGASVVAGVFAHALLYVWTGKVPLPSKRGMRLVEADEAIAGVRAFATKILEEHHA
jgi:hypothetical protein